MTQKPHIIEHILFNISKRQNTEAFIIAGKQIVSIKQAWNKIENIRLFFKQHLKNIPKQRVGIALEREPINILSIYAILSLNACFVPLDLKNPPERLNKILKQTNVTHILGKGERPNSIHKAIKWLQTENIPSIKNATITIQGLEKKPDRVAVILHTSGSTGIPKAIGITYQALEAFCNWTTREFSLKKNDIVANTTPFFFDLSFLDLFSIPYVGGTIHIIPDSMKFLPFDLSNYLKKSNITIWYTVPTLLNLLVKKGIIEKNRSNNLKKLLFAGEKIKSNTLKNIIDLFPKAEFFNLFGPTETNVCCFYHIKKQGKLPSDLPIGKPPNGTLCKLSNNGELLVKGPMLAAGYIKQRELSPFLDKMGWCHTGDICKIDENGNYVFICRSDRIIKFRGYRIDPGEIEKIVYELQEINECVVFILENQFKELALCLVFSEKRTIHLKTIKNHLLEKLPKYMMPTIIKKTLNIPKLSNDKINLTQLSTLI